MGGESWCHLARRKDQAPAIDELTGAEVCSASLAAYLDAARSGTLNVGIVEQLIVDFNALKADLDGETASIDLTLDQAESVVEFVAGRTRTLADANQLELGYLGNDGKTDGATIMDLLPYLEAHRELFKRAS